MEKSSEIIPIQTVAEILGICPQGVRDRMTDGKLNIGLVLKGRGRNTYRIYRAKLAKYLGREPDYVWPEELAGDNRNKK